MAVRAEPVVRLSSARGRWIGAWSGLSGTTAAIAPLLGGWLIQAGSWRWVFIINPPLAALAIAIVLRHVPEPRDSSDNAGIDVLGSVLGTRSSSRSSTRSGSARIARSRASLRQQQ
jgi:MFS family permease